MDGNNSFHSEGDHLSRVDANANVTDSYGLTDEDDKQEIRLNGNSDSHGITDIRQSQINDSFERLNYLEKECVALQKKLQKQNELLQEVEVLKGDLEKSLDTHKNLEDAVLSFEEINTTLQESCKGYVQDIDRLRSEKEEVQRKLDQQIDSYQLLENKYTTIQVRLEHMEELENTISVLTKENQNKSENLEKLEERLLLVDQKTDSKRDEEEKMIIRLEKENKALQNKLHESDIDIEDLELKLEDTEIDAEKFRVQVEKLEKELAAKSSDVDRNETLQSELNKLEAKNAELLKEVDGLQTSKGDLETILDKLKEESKTSKDLLENSKKSMQSQLDETKTLLESSKISCKMLETELKSTKKETQTEIQMLKEQLKERDQQIASMEKVNNELVQQNEQLTAGQCSIVEERLLSEKALKETIAELEQALEELEKDRKLLEKDNLDRMVVSAEKEYEFNKKVSSSSKELERVKFDLSLAQEHLRIATDKNSELQAEIERLKSSESETKLLLEAKASEHAEKHKEEMKSLEKSLKETYDHQIDELKSELVTKEIEMKEIKSRHEKLEETYSSRDSMPSKESNEAFESSSPLVVNGTSEKEIEPEADEEFSKRHFSDTEVLRRKVAENPKPRIQTSSVKESEDEITDTISDRELRRISFRIADGNWGKLGLLLGITGTEYEQLLTMNINAQEKVFRLLVAWRSKDHRPRNELLTELTDALERQKRKDVVRFLKDMWQGTSNVGGFKRKIRSIVRN